MISNLNELQDFVVNKKLNDYRLGVALREVKNSYRDLVGEGIDTWHDFLNQPEVGMTVREANELISIADKLTYEQYCDMPTATAKYLVRLKIDLGDEILYSASTLTTKDFKERYFDIKTNDEGQRTYSFMVMKKCNETGNLTKVHEVESEEVLKAFKDKIN